MPKKLLIWAGIAFAGFYLFTQPANAAGAVGGVFSLLGDAANSAITFLTALFS